MRSSKLPGLGPLVVVLHTRAHPHDRVSGQRCLFCACAREDARPCRDYVDYCSGLGRLRGLIAQQRATRRTTRRAYGRLPTYRLFGTRSMFGLRAPTQGTVSRPAVLYRTTIVLKEPVCFRAPSGCTKPRSPYIPLHCACTMVESGGEVHYAALSASLDVIRAGGRRTTAARVVRRRRHSSRSRRVN